MSSMLTDYNVPQEVRSCNGDELADCSALHEREHYIRRRIPGWAGGLSEAAGARRIFGASLRYASLMNVLVLSLNWQGMMRVELATLDYMYLLHHQWCCPGQPVRGTCGGAAVIYKSESRSVIPMKIAIMMHYI